VDDAIALLDGVLANIPEADPDRVIVWGESRGGGVSLLMGVRDPRVEAVDVFYGLTDYYLPSYHAVVQTMIDYNATNLNHPVLPIALAYLNGHMELESARRFLLRRSVIYFAEQLPQLQIHHGTEDTIVPIEHSDRLMERLEALQQAGIEQEYYRYPGGIHKVESLPESAERTAQFLCSFAKP
jgi:acetyl esterase/lipase